MEKVYLLLRDNVESGPYTIQELLQKQLKPTDMFWIEGKSTAWTYLAELELNVHVEEPNETVEKTLHKRRRFDDIEEKADELRKRALSYKPQPTIREFKKNPELHASTPFAFVNEDSIEIVDHRKKENKTVSEVVATMLIIGLFAGGLYVGGTLINRKEIISPAAIQITPPQKTVNKAATQQVSNKLATSITPAADTSLDQQPIISLPKEKPAAALPTSVAIVKDSPLKEPLPIQPITVKLEEVKTTEAQVKIPVTETAKKEETPKKPVAETEKKPVIDKKEPEENEKKKGFLKGLFRNKKKQDDKEKD